MDWFLLHTPDRILSYLTHMAERREGGFPKPKFTEKQGRYCEGIVPCSNTGLFFFFFFFTHNNTDETLRRLAAKPIKPNNLPYNFKSYKKKYEYHQYNAKVGV